MSNNSLNSLIQQLGKVPGVGKRSAQRIALHLLQHKETELQPLMHALSLADQHVKQCEICGNLDGQSPCQICQSVKRDATILCVVEDVADVWAMERSNGYQGLYHILGGTLSALEGRGPEVLAIEPLKNRIRQGDFQEVILAMNATMDGQTTSHYIAEILMEFKIKVTRLAHGMPMGGELDYLDQGTLAAALSARLVI